MNVTGNNEICERGNELISVLYGEATEREVVDFQQHVKECRACQVDMTSFGHLRQSIDSWKLEALSGLATPQFAISPQFPRPKSAFAAFREFFDLSPLWLKGATGFATLLFVLFAVLAVGKFRADKPTITTVASDAKYTEEQKNVIVQKALEEQKASILTSAQTKTEESKPAPSFDRPRHSGGSSTQLVKGRRPLSRWEREQLAVDLRLLQEQDDDGLELLSDRINQ